MEDKQLRHLYETAFPPEGQIPFDDLKRLLKVMPFDFTAYYDDGTFVGLTIVLNRDDFNWGWYFAVQDELRGRGYGQQILTALMQRYGNHPLVIDIESPNQKKSSNREQRIRRYTFYKRNGFRDTSTLRSFGGIEYTILLFGDGEFTQHNYDVIIADLRKYWEQISDGE